MIHDIAKIRQNRPLILNLTNYVVMNTTANALLAIGASPLMTQASEELCELIAISNALVLNIGTLDTAGQAIFDTAASLAKEKKMPVILDPVGAGASRLRTETSLKLLTEGNITVLRGNASEIRALAQQSDLMPSHGVDSVHESDAAIEAAKMLSNTYECVVVVSGKVDYCIMKNECVSITAGSPLMAFVTGMGCTATAIIAAFLAVNPNPLAAAVNAMRCMGECGEKAAMLAKGPGTFLPHFMDALYAY